MYLVKTTDPGKPVQLTTGTQGSTNGPTLNSDATKAAWIQQDDDVPNSVYVLTLLYSYLFDRTPETRL